VRCLHMCMCMCLRKSCVGGTFSSHRAVSTSSRCHACIYLPTNAYTQNHHRSYYHKPSPPYNRRCTHLPLSQAFNQTLLVFPSPHPQPHTQTPQHQQSLTTCEHNVKIYHTNVNSSRKRVTLPKWRGRGREREEGRQEAGETLLSLKWCQVVVVLVTVIKMSRKLGLYSGLLENRRGRSRI